MTIFLFLVAGAVLAGALGRRRVLRLLLFATVVFAWLAGSGVTTGFLLDRLQTDIRVNDVDWRASNVIVLLGWEIVKWPAGDVTVGVRGASRVLEAARLYRRCREKARSCTILASSGDPTGVGRTEAEAMAEQLIALGVPAVDVILESRSDNTFQNADFSGRIIDQRAFDRVVVVTSGFHLRRARLYFAHFLASPVVGVPADRLDAAWSVVPTALNLSYFDLAATEFLGLFRYRVYTALGWNPPRRG